MACDYGVALEVFQEDRWAPYDQTRSYWYRQFGEFHYGENDDVENPEEWDGGGYSSERVRQFIEKDGYILVTLDNDCGGQYQAIFKADMEVTEDE